MKKPEILTANYEDADLTSAFLKRFRITSPTVPSNLPTACTLNGKELLKEEVLEQFDGETDCLVYWDSSKELRKEKLKRVMDFWMHREPWEDYDFCIFPRDLSYCLGFTHNDRIFLTEIKEENQSVVTTPANAPR